MNVSFSTMWRPDLESICYAHKHLTIEENVVRWNTNPKSYWLLRETLTYVKLFIYLLQVVECFRSSVLVLCLYHHIL